jgi:hypothetical protein
VLVKAESGVSILTLDRGDSAGAPRLVKVVNLIELQIITSLKHHLGIIAALSL